jgi:hypothetical protein
MIEIPTIFSRIFRLMTGIQSKSYIPVEFQLLGFAQFNKLTHFDVKSDQTGVNLPQNQHCLCNKLTSRPLDIISVMVYKALSKIRFSIRFFKNINLRRCIGFFAIFLLLISIADINY